MPKDILLVLDFGHRGPRPGLSNEVIAREVARASDRGDSPHFDWVFAQNGCGEGTVGVGYALEEQGVIPDFKIGVSKRGPNAYLDTKEVVKRFLEFVPLQEGDQVWVACHQTAWTGTRVICQSLGVKPRRLFRTRIPYDPQSHQFQAQGLIQCWLYKFWGLARYIMKGGALQPLQAFLI